jgi:hypothetical protein
MDECERFLARQKPWIPSELTGEYESREILAALSQPGGIEALNKATDEYEVLISHCRRHLREYRKRRAREGSRSALWGLPGLPVGAPRKDWLRQECLELQRMGLSQPEIASELNKRSSEPQGSQGQPSPHIGGHCT